jgi:hypothetical protein
VRGQIIEAIKVGGVVASLYMSKICGWSGNSALMMSPSKYLPSQPGHWYRLTPTKSGKTCSAICHGL